MVKEKQLMVINGNFYNSRTSPHLKNLNFLKISDIIYIESEKGDILYVA